MNIRYAVGYEYDAPHIFVQMLKTSHRIVDFDTMIKKLHFSFERFGSIINIVVFLYSASTKIWIKK